MKVSDGLMWGVAFDTESWGSNPLGYDGPFDSLNIAVTKAVRIGKDANPGGAFLDSTEANDPNGWEGYGPAARFTASIPFL